MDDSDNEAFGVSNIESDTDSMPRLGTVYDSKEEVYSVDDETVKDWFSDVGDDWETLCGMGYVLWFNLRKLKSMNSNLRSNLSGLGQRTKD